MAKTKQRVKELESIETEQPITQPVVSKADDKTALDIQEDKKKLPEGYKKRLPTGTTRRIRVLGKKIGAKNAKVYRVTDDDTGEVRDYDKVKIEGESELVHKESGSVCGRKQPGSVHIKTEASILVGNGRTVGRFMDGVIDNTAEA